MRTTAPAAFRRTAGTFTAGTKTLAQRYFTSPDVFAKEQGVIFSAQWVLVGHQGHIAKVGDFLVQEVAGESIIIVRDQKGEAHAFYNVCRHRGTRLCETQTGHSATIQCPYHAWTYGLDGRLIGAPHMGQVEGFEKAEHSLHAVNLAIWEGFIFVNLAKKPTPLEECFAPLSGKFSHWNLPKLRSARRIEYDVRANWKLIFENYSECYHCPGVHPALQKLTPYDLAENDLCEGPFLGGFMPITKGRSLTMTGNVCSRPVGDPPSQGSGAAGPPSQGSGAAGPPSQGSGVAGPPSQGSGAAGPPSQGSGVAGLEAEDAHRVFYYSIFPSMLLSMHPDYVMVHQVWPQSPERTLILCDWFFHPEAFDHSDFRPDDAIEFWDMTNKQDWHVCELSQQGIASRAYQPGPYSPRESIPAAWDREYLRNLR